MRNDYRLAKSPRANQDEATQARIRKMSGVGRGIDSMACEEVQVYDGLAADMRRWVKERGNDTHAPIPIMEAIALYFRSGIQRRVEVMTYAQARDLRDLLNTMELDEDPNWIYKSLAQMYFEEYPGQDPKGTLSVNKLQEFFGRIPFAMMDSGLMLLPFMEDGLFDDHWDPSFEVLQKGDEIIVKADAYSEPGASGHSIVREVPLKEAFDWVAWCPSDLDLNAVGRKWDLE
jgi:hypothetical protein